MKRTSQIAFWATLTYLLMPGTWIDVFTGNPGEQLPYFRSLAVIVLVASGVTVLQYEIFWSRRKWVARLLSDTVEFGARMKDLILGIARSIFRWNVEA